MKQQSSILPEISTPLDPFNILSYKSNNSAVADCQINSKKQTSLFKMSPMNTMVNKSVKKIGSNYNERWSYKYKKTMEKINKVKKLF